MRKYLTAALAFLLLGLSGCASYTWNVKAYDLSGKLIYQGTVITPQWVTEDGKRVDFLNATLVMEEKK